MPPLVFVKFSFAQFVTYCSMNRDAAGEELPLSFKGSPMSLNFFSIFFFNPQEILRIGILIYLHGHTENSRDNTLNIGKECSFNNEKKGIG